MKINPYIFRGYDLRGEVDKDLNPEIVEYLGRSYGTFLLKRGIDKVVVGHDCRLTSQSYSEAIIKGVLSTGADVFDIGLALAGNIYWAQYYLQAEGCISVSASHNPKEYNGFKFGTGFSKTMESEEIQELKEISENGDFVKGQGKIERKDINETYFNDLVSRFKTPLNFKVVVDPGHSTPGAFLPKILERAGCQVIASHCQIDGSFPIGTPDPTAKDVAERLSQEVLKQKADIGFSYDSDGDRIGVVDDQGNILWNDVLLAIFASSVLEKNTGAKIVFNLLCSKVVEDVILSLGGQPVMWRTGHSFIKAKAQKEKASFAGELSGHFYFLDQFYPHDDGAYSTLRLLAYLAQSKKKLSEILKTMPKYISSPEIKLFCADDKKNELIKKISPVLQKDFPGAQVVDDERAGDGIRLDLKDGMFVVRYSQNGPYLTIKFESKSQPGYDLLRNYIKKLLHNYEEVDWKAKINVNQDALD